jgi:hypothetical protein
LDDKDDVGHAIVIVGVAVDDAILLAIGRDDGEIAIPRTSWKPARLRPE